MTDNRVCIDRVIEGAKKTAADIRGCLVRNDHMNRATPEQIANAPDELLRAVIVAVANNIALEWGCDLAMYTCDLPFEAGEVAK